MLIASPSDPPSKISGGLVPIHLSSLDRARGLPARYTTGGRRAHEITYNLGTSFSSSKTEAPTRRSQIGPNSFFFLQDRGRGGLRRTTLFSLPRRRCCPPRLGAGFGEDREWGEEVRDKRSSQLHHGVTTELRCSKICREFENNSSPALFFEGCNLSRRGIRKIGRAVAMSAVLVASPGGQIDQEEEEERCDQLEEPAKVLHQLAVACEDHDAKDGREALRVLLVLHWHTKAATDITDKFFYHVDLLSLYTTTTRPCYFHKSLLSRTKTP